jgi:hypothetical protein
MEYPDLAKDAIDLMEIYDYLTVKQAEAVARLRLEIENKINQSLANPVWEVIGTPNIMEVDIERPRDHVVADTICTIFTVSEGYAKAEWDIEKIDVNDIETSGSSTTVQKKSIFRAIKSLET